MLCFLTARRLKPGSFEAFREAWEPTQDGADWPEGFSRAYHLRKAGDEDEVISFGFFDGTMEDVERLRNDEGFAQQREQQMERMSEHIDDVLVDGIYEVAEEVTPPGR
jgi:heme-degrading monooxygenase HmoA